MHVMQALYFSAILVPSKIWALYCVTRLCIKAVFYLIKTAVQFNISAKYDFPMKTIPPENTKLYQIKTILAK